MPASSAYPLCCDGRKGLPRRLGGGCQVPIAGHAWIEGSRLEMLGVVASADGQQLFRDQASAPMEQAAELGLQLAERLLASGASEILKALFRPP